MGALTSRQNAGVEEADVVSNHAYKYPPRSGNYFGSHFIMGGERFDTPQPEAYLFGENADLNFLGSRPTPFPYPPPQSNEPTKTLKSLVNIRKESLRFVRCPEPVAKLAENKIGDGVVKSVDSNGKGTYYNIEFTFDCDARCAITIFYFCTEEVTPAGVVYYPRDPAMTSQTYHYKKGANQQFCQISHVFDPSRHPEEDLVYNADREIIPIAIYCVVDEGQDEIRQSHTTIAIVEKHSDGTYVLKALKQKLFVDGLCYLLQEIYGIENKNLDTKPSSDEETEDGGSECVICMCDVRDTLILPCRHLCLCNSCADSLRYQANNCPICRAPFRALLQIRALQRVAASPAPPPAASATDGSMENIPAGYEPVSLLEALNGPGAARPPPPAAPRAPAPTIASPDTDTAEQAAEILNRCNLERSSSSSLASKRHAATPEFRMSVLLAREQDGKRCDKAAASSPLLYNNHGDVKSKSSLSLNYPGDTDTGSLQSSPASGSAHELRRSRLSLRPALEPDSVSPLLTPPAVKEASCCSAGPPPANGALRADDAAPDRDNSVAESPPAASDSEYFTPEEPGAALLPGAPPAETANNVVECAPQRWALPHHVTSLPGTPLSQSSVRSSGDSYSSTSSTRQLLGAPGVPSQPLC
ncbi:E3 ubiquitin-protein ligase MGRN1 [Plodia interpunctella]|uniref:E3 ubiquitin-protein ligase MGRN1 n=1 Tax=Plodia interpunctella TaxID=58824 RepID=UPI002367B9F7|nr:E3 ubiquitin-protein ligase MGRN1 [Plodia interpunctella]